MTSLILLWNSQKFGEFPGGDILEIDRQLEQIMREEQNWDVHGIPEININPHQCDCSDEKLELVQIRKKKGEYMREFECTCCGASVSEFSPLDKMA